MSEMDNEFEEFDYTPDIYTLVDEEGIEQEFELLDILDIEDDRYFALLPYCLDPDKVVQDDGDLVVLKAEMVDGEEMMMTIDDDEEYERVGNIFLEKLADMYEEELEELDRPIQ